MSNLLERITIDPQICHGKPVVRGLRYPVETLLELMSAGMSMDEILADYEDLERDDLLAVLALRDAAEPGQAHNAGSYVNFLIDAQLPRRLTYTLREAGHDALHTLDLAEGNRTSDAEINELSVRDRRVVITKDTDFVDSFLLFRRPYKLLLVSTGNITNADLEPLFVLQVPVIAEAFATYDYLELTRSTLIFHS